MGTPVIQQSFSKRTTILASRFAPNLLSPSWRTSLPVAFLLLMSFRVMPQPRGSDESREFAPTRFVKVGGSWNLELTLTGELAAIGRAAMGAKRDAFVQVSLTPGVWKSIRASASRTVRAPLHDRELVAFTPGSHEIGIRTAAWQEIRVSVSTAPLFASDADLREFASARMRPVEMTGRSAPINATVSDSIRQMRFERVPGLSFGVDSSPGRLLKTGSPVIWSLRPRIRKVWALCSGTKESIRKGLVTASLLRAGEIVKARRADLSSDGIAVPLPDGREGRILELDTGELISADSFALDFQGAPEGVRVEAITQLGGLPAGSFAKLPPRIQALASAEPVALFSFPQPGLPGWEIRGAGWGTTAVAGEPFMRKGANAYFADSKANGGEPATGIILSPPFIVRGNRLTFLANGHGAKNFYELVDADTEESLVRSAVPEKTGPFVKMVWDLGKLQGRKVRFKAVDDDSRDAYAWLAFDEIVLEP